MKIAVIYIAAFMLFVAGCVNLPQMTPEEIAKSDAAGLPAATVKSPAKRETVINLALSSDCAQATHDEQGKPPKSFMRGIALSYARTICRPDSDVYRIATQHLGEAKRDALAHYGVTASTPEYRLNSVFSLMLGSAARESSWRWCVGKDPGASNTSSETCETGLYQTSYNSRSASPALPKLFAQYKADKTGCFTPEYKGTTTCSEANLKNWGTGEGVVFQQLSKDCPGFASEYHAIMLRVNRSHYGPINIKKSLMKSSCTSMFESIRLAIKADPGICSAL